MHPFEKAGRRIAFVSGAQDPWGAEKSLLGIVASLEGSHSVTSQVYSPSRAVIDEVASLSQCEGVLLRAASPYGLLREAYRALRHQKFDAVVLFSLQMLPIAWLRPAESRYVLDLHDYLPTASGRFKLRVLASRADRVVSVSQFSATQLTLRQRSRTVVLHRTVGHGDKDTQKLSRSRSHKYGIIGRLDHDKRIPLAVEAMALVPPPAQLVVRGAPSGPTGQAAVEELKRKAADLLGNRVTFEGATPPAEALQGLDAIIVGRSDEPLGRTVLEAHALGLPVVVPNLGGSREMVLHNEDGLIYTAGNSTALAEALRRLEDGELYQILEVGARKSARARLTLSQYAAAYVAAASGIAPNVSGNAGFS